VVYLVQQGLSRAWYNANKKHVFDSVVDVNREVEENHVDGTNADLLPRLLHDERIEAVHAEAKNIPAVFVAWLYE